ncbi:hypothetical protein [Campylobacter aviculae]|uniref:Uncharacterized protein n=1 Tax=Campylobacter aviculae TaxID=2510190 RepID=A0A4U7BQ82_9BACT|nr:hypothetical protein [Campylobacter aviculae]TKX32400.1 hypothetical protein CQA76_03495 [Campylobacter aviculae]
MNIKENIQSIDINKFAKKQKNLKEIFCENKYNNLNLLHYSINMVKNKDEMVKAQKVDKVDKENYLTKFRIKEELSFYIVNILETEITKSQIKIAIKKLKQCVIIYQSIDSLVIERDEIEKTQKFSKNGHEESTKWQEEN